MTNGRKQAIVSALGLIILVAFIISLPQPVVETSPVAVQKDVSHFHEEIQHVQLKDGSFATITSRDTSSTSTVKE